MTRCGSAGKGLAWQEWSVTERPVQARKVVAGTEGFGEARTGGASQARRASARHGRHGTAGLDAARSGQTRQARLGEGWKGVDGQGRRGPGRRVKAGRGKAGHDAAITISRGGGHPSPAYFIVTAIVLPGTARQEQRLAQATRISPPPD